MRDNDAQRDAVNVAHGLLKAELARGVLFRLTVTTPSMSPAVRVGDAVFVRRVDWQAIRAGDILLCEFQGILRMHRFIRFGTRDGQRVLVTKGDAAVDFDSPSAPGDVLGRVERIERNGRVTDLNGGTPRLKAFLRAAASGTMGYAAVIGRKLKRRGALALSLGAALVLLSLTSAFAAVTISTFSANGGQAQIRLTWATASELRNFGFNVERSTNPADPGAWAKIGFVASQSLCISSLNTLSYTYTDTNVQAGTKYYYRLQLFGAPCGDPNVYYETVVSATASGAAAPTATPTPSPAPTATPTSTPTSLPTATATSVATATPQPSNTPAPTGVPAATATVALPSATPAQTLRAPARPTATAAPGGAPSSANPPANPPADAQPGSAAPTTVAMALPTGAPAGGDQPAPRAIPDEPAYATEPATPASAPAPNAAVIGIGLVAVFGLGAAGFLLLATAGFVLWRYTTRR